MPLRPSIAALVTLTAVLLGCASGPALKGHIVFSRITPPAKNDFLIVGGDGGGEHLLFESVIPNYNPDPPWLRPGVFRGTGAWPTYQPEVEPTHAPLR